MRQQQLKLMLQKLVPLQSVPSCIWSQSCTSTSTTEDPGKAKGWLEKSLFEILVTLIYCEQLAIQYVGTPRYPEFVSCFGIRHQSVWLSSPTAEVASLERGAACNRGCSPLRLGRSHARSL